MGVVAVVSSVERDSDLFGEGDGGLGGLAVLVGMGGGGAEKLLGNVGLRCGEAADEHGDAAGRGEGLRRAGPRTFAEDREPLAGDEFADAALQLFGGGGNHARGNFFGTDL